MGKGARLSRRTLLKNGSIALGAVSACDLAAGIGLGRALDALAAEPAKEVGMPHVSVKIWPGRSEQVKQRLADAIAADIVDILGSNPDSVSVTVEEVDPGQWKEEVYDPLMRMDQKTVYKKPGYSM